MCLRSSYVKHTSNISINYENGDIYNGCLNRGKREGFGILHEYGSGNTYNGSWDNDMVKQLLTFIREVEMVVSLVMIINIYMMVNGKKIKDLDRAS